MKKFIFVFLFVFFISLLTFAFNNSGNNTTLVILEEKENSSFVLGATPFSDGIFTALWDKELLFFDMKINSSLQMVSNTLDIKPFIKNAKDSGADLILVIKFNYESSSDKAGIKLSAKEIQYNVYSLTEMKSLKSATKNIKIERILESTEKKNELLKKIANDILADIYN